MVIRSARVAPFPAELCLVPVGRRPLRLPEATIQTMRNTVLPTLPAPASVPRASIVMVTYNRLAFSVGCLASLLANSATTPEYEIIVVDNASTDGTGEYLQTAAAHQPRIRVVRNSENRGFAPAVNQGLHLATGDVLVILNNDTLVPPGWLEGLSRHLADPNVGLVGPVTNSAPNEAQVETPYRTYGGFEDFAETCKRTFAGVRSVIPMLTMFCVAMRRSTLEALGPLDERYAVGTFEDDDYSQLAHQAGYAVVCAEDVFVHHFGQASFGELVPGGAYAALLSAIRQRFEDKWQIGWQPHA